MPTFCQKDARTKDHDSMSREEFQATYSAMQVMKRTGFDCYSTTGCQGRELCSSFCLKVSLILLLISHFCKDFFNLLQPFQQFLGRALGLCGLCMYKAMILGQELGQYPCTFKVQDLILSPLLTFPNMSKSEILCTNKPQHELVGCHMMFASCTNHKDPFSIIFGFYLI